MKKSKKIVKKNSNKLLYSVIYSIITIILIAIIAGGITIKINHDKITIEPSTYTVSEQQYPSLVEGDLGEIDEDIITIDEIDGGGMFKDQINVGDAEPDVYYELGAIEEVDTSSADAFKKSTLGRCIIANNFYGAQCVSLARAFWWGYAGFDVSTCGTGLAKGMMNCAEQNARNKFKVIWNTNEIQKGTWVVLDGARTGHICMALGKPQNGYISCLGENQGGIPCEYGIGGAGTNVINISLKNFIGGYTPIDYIEPEPQPLPPDTGKR